MPDPAPATSDGALHASPGVLYELEISALRVELGGRVSVDVSDLLGSGRTNYTLFQRLVAGCAGMRAHSEGAAGDLLAPDGASVEVKAYFDPQTHPSRAASVEAIHTAASTTFGPNNLGPTIRSLLAEGDYAQALAVCRRTGYDKNQWYVYTNTRGFDPGQVPLRYVVLPTVSVLAHLSERDPRVLPRSTLLSLVTATHRIDPTGLGLAG